MKRTYERILFMVIGALIAGIAYFVGSSDYTAEAQDGIKTLKCDVLEVSEFILIGDIEGTRIFLMANQEEKLAAIDLLSDENPISEINLGVKGSPLSGSVIKVKSKGLVGIRIEDNIDQKILRP